MAILMFVLLIAALAVQTYTEKSWLMVALLFAAWAVYYLGVRS